MILGSFWVYSRVGVYEYNTQNIEISHFKAL